MVDPDLYLKGGGGGGGGFEGLTITVEFCKDYNSGKSMKICYFQKNKGGGGALP